MKLLLVVWRQISTFF